MSYQLFSITRPRARKDYACIWCPELILKGEVHVHESGKYHGDLQDHRWHPECREAASLYFIESGEDEFEAYASRRGSLEEAT